jgi:hypothetical protein
MRKQLSYTTAIFLGLYSSPDSDALAVVCGPTLFRAVSSRSKINRVVDGTIQLPQEGIKPII